MFVAKNELRNAIKLTGVMFSSVTRRNMLLFSVIACGIFLAVLTANILWIHRETAQLVDVHTVYDYYILMAFCIVIAIARMNVQYRESNQRFEVYPQTNTSRFLCTQVIYHCWIVFLSLFSMALYLIHYGVLAIFAAMYENLHLIYPFSLGYVLTGLVVLIIYASVISGFVFLITALVRKFSIYALTFIAVSVGLILTNHAAASAAFKVFSGFLIFEESVLMFIIKGVAAWVALFVVNFMINKHTVYYQDYKALSKNTLLRIAVTGLTAVIMVGTVGFITMSIIVASGEGGYNSAVNIDEQVEEQIEFDISHLPQGNVIKIEPGDNIIFYNNSDETILEESKNETSYMGYEAGSSLGEYTFSNMTFSLWEPLSNDAGEKLVLYYKFPEYIVNQENVSYFASPQFQARLDGVTLYVNYTFEPNVKVVAISTWPFMKQFAQFNDQGLFNKSNSGDGSQSVGYIRAEVR